MYFNTSVAPPPTPGSVSETCSLKAWASFLQVQWNSSLLILSLPVCPAGDSSLEAALHSYMGNMEIGAPLTNWGWEPMDQCCLLFPHVDGSETTFYKVPENAL